MSEPSDDANRWSWVTPDGKTVSGAKGELMLALRGERLPPGTLVWRSGWGEWLPASRVTELKSVLPPGAAEPAQAPKLTGTQTAPAPARPAAGPSRPPPAPVRNKAPATSRPPPAPVRAKPERRLLEIPGARVPTAGGPVAATSPGGARPRGASILGPPREQMTNAAAARAALPTLGGEEAVPAMTTLRPPGAVPPPPRSVGPALGAPKLDEELATQRRVPSPMATPLPVGAVTASTRAVPAPPASTEAAQTEPSGLPASSTSGATSVHGVERQPVAVPRPPELAEQVEVAPPSTTLQSSAPSAPPPEPAPTLNAAAFENIPTALPGDRAVTLPIPRSVAIVLALAVAGLLVLVTGGLVFSTRGRTATGSGATAASAAEDAVAPGCKLLAPAARLSITAERAVQPVLAEVARGERVAVGFASAPKTAAAAVVRLDTLDAERSADQTGDTAVRSSVPVVKGARVELAVDRSGDALSGGRTLADGTALGFAGADLVRRAGGKTSVLVAGAASDKTTDPRLASSSAGTLLTFRRGGLSGQVLYTWVAPDGSTNGSVTPVSAPDVKFSGTPDAAANAGGGLIAFAGRASENAEWRVQLASVPRSGKASVRQFVTPAGGSGGGNIAPAVAALGDGGWLLQWTEGAAGAYEVRLQQLSQNLEPVGEARLVSPKGANAGQGTLLATGGRVLSVFIQTTAGHDELWGASFECH